MDESSLGPVRDVGWTEIRRSCWWRSAEVPPPLGTSHVPGGAPLPNESNAHR